MKRANKQDERVVVWKNGRLLEYSTQNVKEIMYCHLQKRKMQGTVNPNSDSFVLFRTRIIDGIGYDEAAPLLSSREGDSERIYLRHLRVMLLKMKFDNILKGALKRRLFRILGIFD